MSFNPTNKETIILEDQDVIMEDSPSIDPEPLLFNQNQPPSQKSIYRVQVFDKNTETHEWKVQMSQIKQQKKIFSPIFTVGQYEWELILFPMGNDTEPPQISSYLGVAAAKKLKVGWSRYAKFQISIVNHDDPTKNISRDSSKRFNSQEIDWGFRELADCSKIYDETNGFINNDDSCVYFRVTVNVCTEKYLVDPLNYNSKKETGFVGIENQGCTCYLTSLLQTLFHIPQFRKLVYAMEIDDVNKLTIPLALQKLFYDLRGGGGSGGTKFGILPFIGTGDPHISVATPPFILRIPVTNSKPSSGV